MYIKQIKTVPRKWRLAFDWLPLLILPFINPLNTQRVTSSKKAKNKSIIRPVFSNGLILLGAAGIIYFAFIQTDEIDLKPNTQYPISIPAVNYEKNIKVKEGLERSVPKQLTINNIGVDVPLMELGKQADGTMEVPPLFENIAGWYKHSPTPGEIGPAVIVGHVDTHKGPSVFWRLRELKPGDIINIKREDGKTVKFKVDGLEQFEQDNFPTDKVYGNIDKAGLRLITCGGTFNKKTQRYTENTVVFATYTKE